MGQAHRLQMVHLAVSENEKLKGSDVNSICPNRISLRRRCDACGLSYPNVEFSIIIGEDNFVRLHT